MQLSSPYFYKKRKWKLRELTCLETETWMMSEVISFRLFSLALDFTLAQSFMKLSYLRQAFSLGLKMWMPTDSIFFHCTVLTALERLLWFSSSHLKNSWERELIGLAHFRSPSLASPPRPWVLRCEAWPLQWDHMGRVGGKKQIHE